MSQQYRQRLYNWRDSLAQTLVCCTQPQRDGPTAPPEDIDIERYEPEAKQVRFPSSIGNTYRGAASPADHLPPSILKN